MKHFTLLIAGLVLPLSEALAGSWGVTGNIGHARGDADATVLNNQISAQGLNATASSSKLNRTAWQLMLAYQYTPEWSVELGYVDLGDVATKLSGNTADINSFLTSVSDIHPQTAYGWQLSASYHYPVEETLSIVVRAGILNWRSKYRLESTEASLAVNADGNSGMFSLGIDKGLGQNKIINFNYSQYDIDGESIPVLGVGLTYTFN